MPLMHSTIANQPQTRPITGPDCPGCHIPAPCAGTS